jgi:hypothetical protein
VSASLPSFEDLLAEAAAAAPTPDPGTLLAGRYKVEGPLGEGGFGMVVVVVDT